MSPTDQSAAYTAALQALQRRAEALARGELSALGTPVSDLPAVEDLRRAIDVLGAHTESCRRPGPTFAATRRPAVPM